VLDEFIVHTLGESARRHYRIIIDDQRSGAPDEKSDAAGEREPRETDDAYSFNWSIRITRICRCRSIRRTKTWPTSSFIRISRWNAGGRPARAFSGIVAGNVKEVGIQAIEKFGPYKLHGDPEMMRRMDDLLQGFVAQHRMKLPGGTAYIPCYEICS
jgi:hypothetical protein